MEPDDGDASGNPVTFEQFMGRVAVYLGMLSGDRYAVSASQMPGASWDDAAHPMYGASQEANDADAS